MTEFTAIANTEQTVDNLSNAIQFSEDIAHPAASSSPSCDNAVQQPTEIVQTRSTYTPSTALQSKAHYRIDPKKWCGLFRGYVRQDWDTFNVEDGIDELRAHWVELFFDLIYVACIVQLSAEVSESIASDAAHRRLASSSACEHEWKYSFLLTGFAQFGLLTNAWIKQLMYITHFVFNQYIDDGLRLLFMLSILAMGIFIRDDESYERAFLISYQWLHMVAIFMFLKVLLIPRGKWHAVWHITQSVIIIAVIFPIVSLVRGKCSIHYFSIYSAFFLFENIAEHLCFALSFYCPVSQFHVKTQIPINVPHISERYGLFIMIILGESIISVMGTNLGSAAPSQLVVAFVLLTFVLSFFIARLYFDCQPNEESIMNGDGNHALRISPFRARLYMHAHQLLFFGLLGFGMGIKISGKHLLDTQRRYIDVVLPGYALVIIIISLNVIRIAHPYNVHVKVWIFRIILLLIMIVTPLFALSVNNGVIFVIMFVCILLQLVADVEGKEQIKMSKEELKDKRQSAKQENSVFEKMQRMHSGVGKI